MIAIVREDLGEEAIPGGMADHGEKVSGTLARELCEETLGKEEHSNAGAQEKKLQQMFERATPVYQGYVDDPRNTDNSWMETQAFHLHLTPDEAKELNLQKGSDAAHVEWKPITSESLGKMYASHGSFVKQAVLLWQQDSGLILGNYGTGGGNASPLRVTAYRTESPKRPRPGGMVRGGGVVVLGINEGINSSVVVSEAGQIRFALQEERVCRQKEFVGFPHQALEFTLSHLQLQPKDIDAVCLSNLKSPGLRSKSFTAPTSTTPSRP